MLQAWQNCSTELLCCKAYLGGGGRVGTGMMGRKDLGKRKKGKEEEMRQQLYVTVFTARRHS